MNECKRVLRVPAFVLCLIVVAVLACSGDSALAQSQDQHGRVAASFLLALGRAPASGEAQQWVALGPLPIADLIARHRRALERDPPAGRDVIGRAARDAFGRAAESSDAAEVAGATYLDVMQRHLQWLGEHPADYEQVIRRAYRLVLQRDAYSIEIEYWKRQPGLTFALLAGSIENWAVRNQPGLTATSGPAAISVNSAYLVTARLSPAVAAEARIVAGLAPVGGRTLASATGRHVVAPGAESIISVGGIHFVAAGDSTLDAHAAGPEGPALLRLPPHSTRWTRCPGRTDHVVARLAAETAA